MEYSKKHFCFRGRLIKIKKKFIKKEVAERLKAIDCKSIELCSTLVQIQLSLEGN